MDFAKHGFSGKIGKHELFLMISKKWNCRCAKLFWPFSRFGVFSKTNNTIKIGKAVNFGTCRKMHPKKGAVGIGVAKGCHCLIQRDCALLEKTIYSVVNKTQQLQKKGCKLHKTENSPKIVDCCSSCARSFWLAAVLHALFWMVGCVVLVCCCVVL